MKIYDIVSQAGMSTRPEFYSGRGAIRSDLNSDILFKIHHGIGKHFGEPASESFVLLVEAMPELSATAFLNELYLLAGNDFKFQGIAGFDGFDFAKNEDGTHNLAQGMASLMSALGNNRNDTESIRAEFLSRFPKKTKRWGIYPCG